MPLELQQLRQVIALAEHGSFVRAATALHISQPALSRSIQNLERRFGSELFLRASGGVVPTDLGRLYIERARDVLRMADELDREAVTHGALGSGRVAVGGGPYPAESFLGPAAVRFVEQYPKVCVHLRARDWDGLLRELRSRDLDFFVAETSTLQREPDLEITPMASAHAGHIVARSGHPLAARRPVDMEEALAYPFVTPSRIPPRILDPMMAAHRASAPRLRDARPFPAIHCNGLAPVKQMLATSDAVTATILSCIAAELERGEFVVLGTAPWMHLHYGIVSLKGRPWTRAAEALREFVLLAEREASAMEKHLLERFQPRARRLSGRARKAARGGGTTDDHGDD
jgi:DNA-binding transcriptional LysR family regulator